MENPPRQFPGCFLTWQTLWQVSYAKSCTIFESSSWGILLMQWFPYRSLFVFYNTSLLYSWFTFRRFPISAGLVHLPIKWRPTTPPVRTVCALNQDAPFNPYGVKLHKEWTRNNKTTEKETRLFMMPNSEKHLGQILLKKKKISIFQWWPVIILR